jgi:hypothetical protein
MEEEGLSTAFTNVRSIWRIVTRALLRVLGLRELILPSRKREAERSATSGPSTYQGGIKLQPSFLAIQPWIFRDLFEAKVQAYK